jgi:hypothetical protein
MFTGHCLDRGRSRQCRPANLRRIIGPAAYRPLWATGTGASLRGTCRRCGLSESGGRSRQRRKDIGQMRARSADDDSAEGPGPSLRDDPPRWDSHRFGSPRSRSVGSIVRVAPKELEQTAEDPVRDVLRTCQCDGFSMGSHVRPQSESPGRFARGGGSWGCADNGPAVAIRTACVLRIHRIVSRTDDEGRHIDVLKISRAAPGLERAAHAYLARGPARA